MESHGSIHLSFTDRSHTPIQ